MHRNDTTMYVTLRADSASQYNSGVILGSHVFLISQKTIIGWGAVLAVCLPPCFSYLARNWTSISAKLHPIPTSPTHSFSRPVALIRDFIAFPMEVFKCWDYCL